MENKRSKFLKEDQRREMYFIYQITTKRRQFMDKIQTSMHNEIDPYIEKVVYQCPHCFQKFKGKEYGAHFRNTKECKYLKDRPWLKNRLPQNWKSDLKLFEQQQMEEYP